MTATETIADALAEVRYDRLPDATKAAVRRLLLDALIVGMAGVDAEGVPALRRWATAEEVALMWPRFGAPRNAIQLRPRR